MTSHRGKMRNNWFLLWLMVVCAFVSSCDDGEIYYRYQHIAKAVWSKDSALVFRIDSLAFKPMHQYDISIEIVNNNLYPYQNLWLYLEHNFADSVFYRDSLQIALTDSHGRPKGSGVGGLYQLSVPYKKQIFRDSIYSYELRVRQAMKDDPLRGIEKIGLKIQEKP